MLPSACLTALPETGAAFWAFSLDIDEGLPCVRWMGAWGVLGKQTPKSLLGFQAIILPQVLTGIAANILNVAMNAFFLYALKLGMV